MNIVIPHKRIKLRAPDGISPEQIKELVETHWDDLPEASDLEPGIPEIRPEVAQPVSTVVAPPEEPIPERLGEFAEQYIPPPLAEGFVDDEGPALEQLERPPLARRAYEKIKEKFVGRKGLYYPEMEPDPEFLKWVDPFSAYVKEHMELTGQKPMPATSELLGDAATLGIGVFALPYVAAAPVASIVGVGSYMLIEEFINLAASARKDIDWRAGASKGLSDIVGVKGGAIKTSLDLTEFIGKLYGAGKATGAVGAMFAKDPAFKALADREKGLFTLEVARKAGQRVKEWALENPVKVLTQSGKKKIRDIQSAAAKEVLGALKGVKERAEFFKKQEKGFLFPGRKPKAWSVSKDEALGAAFSDLNVEGFIKFAKGKGVIVSKTEPEKFLPLIQEYMSTHPESVIPKQGRLWPGVPIMKGKPGGPVEKLYGLMDEIGVKKAGAELAGKFHAELQRRVSVADKALKAGVGEQAFFDAKHKLRGVMPKVEFEPLRPYFEQREIDHIFNLISNYRDRLFTRLHAHEALESILDGKAVRGKDRLRALSKILGHEFVKTVQKRRPIHERATEQILDVLNAPRAVMTAGDLSATLRQGIFLVTRHPRLAAKAFGAQMKALLSEDAAVAVDKSLDMGRFALLREKSGLYRAPILYRGGALAERPEPFMSNLASKLPIVKQSERAFITFTNKLRADAFDHVAGKWKGTPNDTSANYEALAGFINAATGRGNLGKWGETGGAILNAAFFSPRFFASRFQVPWTLVSPTTPLAVRKYAAGTVTSFVGTGLTILGLAKLGGADVELDPRSSDFGKIRIGQLRYDYWGSYIPIARYTTQLAMNERKALTSGRIYDIPGGRSATALRWLRSKASPPAGLLADFLSEKTYRGEEFTPRALGRLWKEGTTTEKIFDNPIWRRMMFMSAQDLVDAIRFQSLDGGYASRIGTGVISSIPAVLGVGMQTYERGKWQESFEMKESLALENYGAGWEDLSGDAQEVIRTNHPEIEALERSAKFERREEGGVLDLRRMQEEQTEAAEKVKDHLKPEHQEEIKRLGIVVPGLGRQLGTWRLNDERYEYYQQRTHFYLDRNLSRLMGLKSWQGWDDDKKTEKIEDAISDAKKKARVRVEKGARREMPK